MTYYDTGVTEEERQAFMNRMKTDKPDDIKRGSDGEYYVEKVIKMQCLVKWIDYPLSEATWEPFENLSGQEACEYLDIFTFTIT